MPQSKNEALTSLNINQSQGGAAEFGAVFGHLAGKMQTVTLVKVERVDSAGVSPVGTVDVRPLVHQVDGAGNVYPMPVLYSVPYFRLQGGANAVICDPQPGDIGLCAFASRDISKVKRTKAAAAPGSKRQYDWSDGLYIGGYLNDTPKQYVYFHDGGIKIVSPGDIELEGANIKITASAGVSSTSQTFQANTQTTAEFTGPGGIGVEGDIKTDQDVNAQGDVTAGTVSVQHHTHKDTQPGGGNSGEPNT